MLEEFTDKFQNQYEMFPEGKLFRISFDNVTRQLKISARRKDLFDELRNAFSFDNPAAFFTRQYGYKVADKIYNINQFGYFGPGMIYEVLNWIKDQYGSLTSLAISTKCQKYIQTYITPLKNDISQHGQFPIANISEDVGRNQELRRSGKQPFEFRGYQEQSISALLFKGFGRGLIEIPTAGGKSFIIANFIWNLLKNVDRKMKFMIFVPNVQLVAQFYSDLIDYGFNKNELAKFTGGMNKKEKAQHDIHSAKIVIANRQYVFKNAKELPKFDCLICDEVHQADASSSQDFIENFDCRLKIGCSGTLPQDKYKLNNLIGMFSRIVFKESITRLQTQGFISKLKITLLDIYDKHVASNKNYLFNLNSNIKFHQDEYGQSSIAFNDAFNQEIEYYNKNALRIYKPILEYLSTIDENILVLFDKIELGRSLYDFAQEIVTNKKSHYIDGSTPVDKREEIRAALEQSGDNILIGNVAVVGTGINIKRLNTIVFLINTKSHSRILQSIGRILRLHSTKDIAHLIDVRANYKYSNKHYLERQKFYRQFYNKPKPDQTIKIEI